MHDLFLFISNRYIIFEVYTVLEKFLKHNSFFKNWLCTSKSNLLQMNEAYMVLNDNSVLFIGKSLPEQSDFDYLSILKFDFSQLKKIQHVYSIDKN